MKKALLAGINKYKMSGNDLQGCVNDVINMRELLKTYFKFVNNDIRIITDDRVTKKELMTRLNWLVTGNKPGDTIIFHYSGHGSQVRDRHNDELSDGLDELICPYDMDWNGTYITDDELHSIFEKVPKDVNCEVFLDCCHSGTGLKEALFGGRPEELSLISQRTGKGVARFIPPPIDVLCRSEGEEKNLKNKTFTNPSNEVNAILWAGCKSDQTSADAYIGGKFNGAFTFALTNSIKKVNGNITRSNLINEMRKFLNTNGYEQIPQLECSEEYMNKKFLGI